MPHPTTLLALEVSDAMSYTMRTAPSSWYFLVALTSAMWAEGGGKLTVSVSGNGFLQ